MSTETTEAVKHVVDGSAILAAVGSFFHLIPWVEISACLSSIWLLLRISEWVYKKWKERD